MHWHQFTKTQLESELETNGETGLSEASAAERLKRLGPNLLPEPKTDSWLVIFLRQFQSPLVYVLIGCAAIIYGIGEHSDSFIILVVLLFNAAIGAYQEGKSSNALRSLRKLSAAETTVVRGGVEQVIPEREVVMGDVLLLQEGQKITADARVISASNLGVDEAALTGESGAVNKHEGSLGEPNVPVAAQHNMLFKGTNVLSGSGKAIVVGTAVETEIGKISKALQQPQTEIPLQRNIRRLSTFIMYAIVGISTALFLFGISVGRPAVEMFSVVVSLAVSLIPEGLPLVLTLILVTGVWRMSRRNALVKKLQAVEALGQADVIAVDKTGTLTKNEMVVKKMYVGGRFIEVSGEGYDPHGALLFKGQHLREDADIRMAGTVASLSSRASVLFSEQEQRFRVSGDPTEAAMAVLGEKMGLARKTLEEHYEEAAEITFNHKTKYHAIFYEHKGLLFCAAAGAPEVMLSFAQMAREGGREIELDAHRRAAYESAVEELSSAGLRVVAFGYKTQTKDSTSDSIAGLVFGGLLGIEDSIRPEVASAVAQAERAGVKIVMITGDHKTTAKAIAREAGIYKDGDGIITGTELSAMSAEQLAEQLMKVTIFARVTPDDKMKIIRAYKARKLIIAMTGDGVNDAPSLVAADLGVAMGKIGTEVAKEAGDIVLLDDNLSSIVAAIEEGRAMYKNIQKALLFLFSTSLGELLSIVLALFLHMPMPLLAVQILWLNLLTDPLIGIALALDKKDPGLLSRKESRLPAFFMTKTMLGQMLILGLTMSVGTLYLFSLYHPVDYWKALTISLTTLAVFQWYNGFNCSFLEDSIFTRKIFRNRYLWLALLVNVLLQLAALYVRPLQELLKTTPLSWAEWSLILVLSFSIVVVEELRKLAYRLWKR